MSGESFPRVYSLIANLCTSNGELREQCAQLEKALTEKETLSEQRAQLEKDMQNLQIDLMLLRPAANIMSEDRAQIENFASFLEDSYGRLLQMSAMLDDDRMRHIQRFAVLRKQTDVQEKLSKLEEQQRFDLKYKTAMEDRTIVKEFRKWQSLVQEAEQKSTLIAEESDQLQRQWRLKIERATEQRNKKIVALAQLRKQIVELDMPAGHRTQVIKEPVNKASRSAPIVLQSALDFIHKFPVANPDADTMDTVEPPLRSILVVGRSQDGATEAERTCSPIKQVHFAPLPTAVHKEYSDKPLNDMTQMQEMNETYSVPSQFDAETTPSTEHFPERAVIEKVEELQSFDISTPLNARNNKLNFKNLFEDDEDSVQSNMEFEPATSSRPASQMQSEDIDDDDNMSSSDLNFASAACQSNYEFLFNMSDGNSTEDAGNGHAYEL